MRNWRASLFLFSALVACGGKVTLIDDDAHSDAPFGNDAAPSFDSGEPDGGIPVIDATIPDATPPALHTGMVILQANNPGSSDSTAVFYADGQFTCSNFPTPGSCVITQCADTNSGQGSSAGVITIAGGPSAVALLPSLGPNGTHYKNVQGTPYPPTQTLSVTAAGDAVPGFQIDVVMPGSLTFTSPQFGPGIIVDSSQDFVVAWTGSSSSEVLFELAGANTAQAQVLFCSFDSAAQKGVVPAPFLQKFKATFGGGQVGLAVAPWNHPSIAVGDWGVTVIALARPEATSATLQ